MEYTLSPLETPYWNQPSYVLPPLGCQYEYPKQCVYNQITESTSQTNSSHKHRTITGTTTYLPSWSGKTRGWVISLLYSTSIFLVGSLSSQYSQKLCIFSSIPLLILCDLSVWTTVTAPRPLNHSCHSPPNSIFQIVVVMIKKIIPVMSLIKTLPIAFRHKIKSKILTMAPHYLTTGWHRPHSSPVSL